MPSPPDTSDLRALARVILDQEDLEQSAIGARVRPYELAPVRRRAVEGARVGLLVGVGVGLASVGSATARTFRPSEWVLYLALFIAIAIAAGAIVGASAGLVVQWTQRRRIDAELAELAHPPRQAGSNGEGWGGPRSR